MLGPEDIKPARAREWSADGQERQNSTQAQRPVTQSTPGESKVPPSSDRFILTTGFV
jgi:hypothetical protein